VVIFNNLTEEYIYSIIDILMRGVKVRLENLGLTLELSEEAKKFISEKGYDSAFGARPLHRAIQKYLEDPLAEEILNMNIKTGDLLRATLDKENEKIIFKVESTSGEMKKEMEEKEEKSTES
jgi:ATP-dependent Clp protease ATP-binding subunit ClpC